jgi:hypothetical protein
VIKNKIKIPMTSLFNILSTYRDYIYIFCDYFNKFVFGSIYDFAKHFANYGAEYADDIRLFFRDRKVPITVKNDYEPRIAKKRIFKKTLDTVTLLIFLPSLFFTFKLFFFSNVKFEEYIIFLSSLYGSVYVVMLIHVIHTWIYGLPHYYRSWEDISL